MALPRAQPQAVGPELHGRGEIVIRAVEDLEAKHAGAFSILRKRFGSRRAGYAPPRDVHARSPKKLRRTELDWVGLAGSAPAARRVARLAARAGCCAAGARWAEFVALPAHPGSPWMPFVPGGVVFEPFSATLGRGRARLTINGPANRS
jgi:hypothetical protein